jgi:large subunit ribosomal protein L15e
MSMYKAMRNTFIQEYKTRPDNYKQRIVEWCTQPPVVNAGKPTNIARARELGYKAKEGVIIVRVQVKGGKKKAARPWGGRKPSKNGRYFSITKSSQAIAEERAGRKFINCTVLNSYFVGSAGSRRFFEVILLDRASRAIQTDEMYKNIIKGGTRAFRGLTFAGRKHRGLTTKGFGTSRARPSVRQGMVRREHNAHPGR